MNKIFAYNRRFNLSVDCFPSQIVEKPADVSSKHKQLLDYIFADDPVTGMPQGDIAMFANPNVNSEVKRFIEENLMREMSGDSSAGSLNLPDDIVNKYRGTITDDDIVRFSRNHGESVEEYSDRLRGWFVSEKARRQSEFQKERLKKYFGES